jgi:hypothetical protein
VNTTLLAPRPTRDSQTQDHLDELRETLVHSVARVKAERDRIRDARDSIPPLQRRFDSEGHRLWLQLDDWLNGLDAAVTDAPELAEKGRR